MISGQRSKDPRVWLETAPPPVFGKERAFLFYILTAPSRRRGFFIQLILRELTNRMKLTEIKEMLNKRINLISPVLSVIIVLTFVIGGTGCTDSKKEAGPATREVTDISGRRVNVPVYPRRVATMPGPIYEMVFMLGAKDQIGLVRQDHATVYPLALLTNPELAGYPKIANVGPRTPVNIEEYLKNDVDLVIYYNIPQELKKFDMAGLPAVVLNLNGNAGQAPADIDEAIADLDERIRFTSEVLGGDAPGKYRRWSGYLHDTVERIRSRTSKIPRLEYPVVYWANSWGPNLLATYITRTNKYFIELCGGKLAGPEKGGKFPEITREQLLVWEPEVIIIDNHGRNPTVVIEELRTDADWASLPAVKSDRIHRIPSGVFFLDKASSKVVFFLWLAKKLHPEIFQDVDMVQEMKYYFETFYNYKMTTEEAEKALQGWGR